MPNRILKESICTSDTLQELSPDEEVMWYRLIVNCDDYGRMDARPAILRARLFPLKLDRISEADVSRWLQHLAQVGLVTLYHVNKHPYLQAVTWERHQQIRAKRSKFPAPEDGEPMQVQEPSENLQASDIRCNQVIADVPVIQSESNPNPNPIHVAADAASENGKEKRTRKTTKRDAMKAALDAEFGQAQTKQETSLYYKTADFLLNASPPVEPDDVSYLCQQWPRHFKNATLTITCLPKWLHKLRPIATGPPNGSAKSTALMDLPTIKKCSKCGVPEAWCECENEEGA